MSQRNTVSTENNFSGGLKTEFTGLNFPENACTDTSNCIFDIIGDVTRREGFDYETNASFKTLDRTGEALSTYRWLNVGGDGLTQILVNQVGGTLYFYETSAATSADPLSSQLLVSTVTLSTFLANGSSKVPDAIECQYTDGNGYLFVFHPYLDPIYCSFSEGTITAKPIAVQIRDFNGVPEPGVPVTFRSTTLTVEHNYNLQNQGWTQAPAWATTSSSLNGDPIPANYFFTVTAGLSITPGTPVSLSCSFLGVDYNGSFTGTGTVFSYSGTSLVISVTYLSSRAFGFSQSWTISSSNVLDLIDAWNADLQNYPSNADVWWTFKDSTGVFNPLATVQNIPASISEAPQGHFILNAFDQNRTTASGIAGLAAVTTATRPKTGTWFQGRVWYTGVDASQQETGDQPYYTWTENLYFSQIIVDSSQFGMCYQTDDPTDPNLFLELPTDGGVVSIQGCGSIYKLFPIQNGLLVFASNGIWFITGSKGIGFSAIDYTVTKISSVQSISSTSFVNVQGLPMFWNEEGIYAVEPAQQGLGLTVNPITVGTILSFYSDIPVDSKRYVRGDYNPIDYLVQWTYRSTQETDVTSRYSFDTILNFNVYTKAFYPYTLVGTPSIHGVNYINYPQTVGAPDPTFKYLTSFPIDGTYNFTFSEERDFLYRDWFSFDGTGTNYSSYFVTGYRIHGQALRQWQPEYVYMYSKTNELPSAYTIQGIWDYATSGNSGKFSAVQVVNLNKPYFGIVIRRHRIRGTGLVLQFKISSVTNQPFDIIGWAVQENQNTGI